MLGADGMRQIKSPMQMRREAERRGAPAPQRPGEVNPAERPSLAPEAMDEHSARSDWLAHIRTGRIKAQR